MSLKAAQSFGPRVILAVFFLLCFAPRPVQGAHSEFGDTLVEGSIAEPSNLIPCLASDSASQSIVGKVFNGLLRYNPRFELEGELAESWEIRDEGQTLVFHLKPNVRWHDGRPFTAEDVAFTYQTMIDPANPTPYAGDYEKVSSFEVLDPLTVRVHYSEAYSPALSSWIIPIMPQHKLQGEDLARSDFARNPVGTGPYRFKRWITADRVELIANKDYFEGRPGIDRIVERVIPDPATLLLELHEQSVDLMTLTPLQYRRQTENAYFEKYFQKFKYPNFGYTYVGYNLLNPLFEDVRVRRALNRAVNKEEIIDGVLMGLGRRTTGPFSPDGWAYNPAVKDEAFDPTAAVKLLAEAGWIDRDADGILDKDGRRFEFTLITNQGNTGRQQSAEIIQRRLGEIGIRMKIKVIEWSAFIHEFIDKKKFDAVLLAWGLSFEPDPYAIWHSSKTREGEFNFISYRNERVDELILKAQRTFDRNERQAYYHEIHRIIHEEQPVMFLFVPETLPIVHRRFQNVEATPIGLGYNLIDWSVPASERKYTRYEA